MDESSTQYSLVRRYLANLGYQESLVATEVPIKEAQEIKRVDLIVYEHDHPHIAIEIKSEIPDKKDTELLKFHPYVRRLQSNAATLGAPYYLLTDGISFLWFMTDTSGRPKLLDAPLYSSEANETHIQPSKDFVVQALRSLQQYLYNRAEQGNELATLIILAKLLSERGDKQLRQHLLYREPLSSSSYYFSLLELTDYSYMRVDRN